jgi:hypothetical protein
MSRIAPAFEPSAVRPLQPDRPFQPLASATAAPGAPVADAAAGRKRLPVDPWLCGVVAIAIAGLAALSAAAPAVLGLSAGSASGAGLQVPRPAEVAGVVHSSLTAVARAILPPPPCRVAMGFALLEAHVGPSVVGQCLEDEHFDPAAGTSMQRTTGGMLVWRKADNALAFTDGYRTWVLGPFGLQQRYAASRYCWEADADPGTCEPAMPAPPAPAAPAAARPPRTGPR